MPLVLRPTGRKNIWPRLIGNCVGDELTVHEQLHLDTFPRCGVVDSPTGNSRFSYLAPAVKVWRQHGDKSEDRERAHEKGLDNGLADEYMDQPG